MRSLLDINDILILAGLALLAAGAFLIYPPAALAVPGALLFILGVSGAWRGGG